MKKVLILVFFLAPVVLWAQDYSEEHIFYDYQKALQTPEKVQKLDLSNSGIARLPGSLRVFVNLEVLNLSGNQFLELPTGLELLTNLKVLNLSNMPHLDMLKVLRKVSQLKNLERLELKGNQMQAPGKQRNPGRENYSQGGVG